MKRIGEFLPMSLVAACLLACMSGCPSQSQLLQHSPAAAAEATVKTSDGLEIAFAGDGTVRRVAVSGRELPLRG